MSEAIAQEDSSAASSASAFLAEAAENVDTSFEPSVVLPGDSVTDVVTRVTKRIRLGKVVTANAVLGAFLTGDPLARPRSLPEEGIHCSNQGGHAPLQAAKSVLG
jgi:hypothetical protein